MTEAALSKVCDMLADAIKFLGQEIDNKVSRIEVLSERIEKLQGQPKPDLAQIKELTNDVQELELQLKSDRPQLSAFQDEFAASCGPS